MERGLGDLEAEVYAHSENPVAWALASWMDQRQGGRVELRLHLLERVLRRVSDEWYRRLLIDTIRTYFKLNRTERYQEQEMLRSQPYSEVNEMLHTDLGRMEERARREALQQGLLSVINARFSATPDGLVDRVRRIRNVTTLDELIRRAAVAASLQEIEALLDA